MRRVLLIGFVIVGSLIASASLVSAGHKPGHGTSTSAAAKSYAPDFVPPKDSEWGWDIGGFGGEQKGKSLAFTPVILMHGNTEDHSYWRVAVDSPPRIDVPNLFKASDYTDQEIWALSYNGTRCGGSACGTGNDVNVPDIYNFIQAVRAYTGAAKVDLVTHSLGVTLTRRAFMQHPDLLDQVEDFVGISGANHGTTICRGIQATWYGCDEIAPGTQWLADLNAWNPKGEGDETPGPVRYMTLYDGTGATDVFFVGPDASSPQLSGAADNHQFPGGEHFALGRSQQTVPIYLDFVKGNNQVARTDAGPVITVEQRQVEIERAAAAALAATGSAFQTSLGWWLLAAALALAVALVRKRTSLRRLS